MIINVHHRHAANVGDMLSAPLNYFDFHESQKILPLIDRDNRHLINSKGLLLIGGGGLLTNFFKQEIDTLKSGWEGPVVFWGPGINKHAYPNEFPVFLHGWTRKKRTIRAILSKFKLLRQSWHFSKALAPDYEGYEEILKDARIVGLRDFDKRWKWTPCVSCLHPAIKYFREFKPTEHIGVIEHPQFMPIHSKWEKMANTGNSIENVLNFIARFKTLITSSYHAAYWATLMNRKTVIIPWSSKFMTFKWELPIAIEGDCLKNAISDAQPFPDALEESIELNLSMANAVTELSGYKYKLREITFIK